MRMMMNKLYKTTINHHYLFVAKKYYLKNFLENEKLDWRFNQESFFRIPEEILLRYFK